MNRKIARFVIALPVAASLLLSCQSTAPPPPAEVPNLVTMSDAELDALFASSPAGDIPNGEAFGSAIVNPGKPGSAEIAAFINAFAWQGKIFDKANGTLVNHIGPAGTKAILAKVYIGKSLIDGKDCIVLDYSTTSLVAHHVRDEIRRIGYNSYLGPVYWDNKKLFYFLLQFN